MAVLAVIIPLLMLGVVLALGRYEEILLPPAKETSRPDRTALGQGPDQTALGH